MMRSLFSGVAGLKTHQTKMDVIGNNISNVNTVAFKSSSTTFSDIMYQTTSQASGATANRGGTNAKQIGLGVTNGATKISITSAGAAQSTGDALDIRLTDSNSTNFFIVNNGSENLFTRAGSFYIDGNGNLAMTTTGYLVMGWQVDPQDPANVIKDTVTPLRVMRPENLTSAPEATTNANFSGVIDKNDSQFSSSNGYIRSFTFYDNLGYSYTAKFAIKRIPDEIPGEYNGKFTVELSAIYDSENNDILANYLRDGGNLQDIFGENVQTTSAYEAVANTYSFSLGGLNEITMTDSSTGNTYNYNNATQTFVNNADPTDTLTLSAVSGIPNDKTVTGVSITIPAGQTSTNILNITTQTIGYELSFDTSEGFLNYAGVAGNKNLMLNTALLGPNKADAALSNIDIDFSKMLNYDNGGTSTCVANRGVQDGSSMRGEGKKLGTMTGLSVQNSGKIYGSYSNGNTVLLGQIAVAQFANASGLEEMGDNCYQTTLNSGEFDGIGIEVSADGSSMNTGQLEMSNVDLSGEFTDMITTQRGFQANSRIITVSDTMLEELINLKR
ncbi:flagellar hook protein FlgE [Pseudobutyrivibrio sp.]|uniref:flagellar hook protein FlgE n=1 Tax=Pseudobutyrivibrio sp. TaxID=2014367 RepID=UPI0025F951B4|nr:flagellar hook-basal body complex protein [Pseudobutyrivibrio sp.]MBR5650478.1 flagellar hook-basal body complex protein [Pseudobutyrivibrio sp.]